MRTLRTITHKGWLVRASRIVATIKPHSLDVTILLAKRGVGKAKQKNASQVSNVLSSARSRLGSRLAFAASFFSGEVPGQGVACVPSRRKSLITHSHTQGGVE